MYTGVSCPVSSRNIDVGIVFMRIWKNRNLIRAGKVGLSCQLPYLGGCLCWLWLSQEMTHLLLQQRWLADSLSSHGERPQRSGCLSQWCDVPLAPRLSLRCPHVTGCRSEEGAKPHFSHAITSSSGRFKLLNWKHLSLFYCDLVCCQFP